MTSQKKLRLLTMAIIMAGMAAVIFENASGAVQEALAEQQAVYRAL